MQSGSSITTSSITSSSSNSSKTTPTTPTVDAQGETGSDQAAAKPHLLRMTTCSEMMLFSPTTMGPAYRAAAGEEGLTWPRGGRHADRRAFHLGNQTRGGLHHRACADADIPCPDAHPQLR
jgi:hypothetical protein